jgi:hypothetical protein
MRTRVFALTTAFAALLVAFFIVVRPWYRQWGATDQEIARPLPGDEIIPNAAGQETRAITIDAPPDRVWPWLAQLGQDRGGFYSYDLLENLVGCEMPTTDVLRPDEQQWRLGDKLWMYPPGKAGGIGFATLRAFEPGRVLGFATRATGASLDRPESGSWTFVLEPLGDSATRLLVRGRGAAGRSLLGVAFDRSMFEPMHFAMERRTMIGLKQLAEEGWRDRLANHWQVLLWAITFALFLAAGVMVLRREYWYQPLVGFVAAGVLFQVLTLGQPPVAFGATLVGLLGVFLWPPARGSTTRAEVTPASSRAKSRDPHLPVIPSEVRPPEAPRAARPAPRRGGAPRPSTGSP